MWLRIFVPGIFILIVFTALLLPNLDTKTLKSVLDLQNILFAVLIPFFGVIYHVSRLRFIIWKPHLLKVDKNLKNQLLEPFKTNVTPQGRERILKGNTLIQMFYDIVDSTESLSDKSKGVRFNGIIWTSVADIVVLGILCYLAFFAFDLFYNRLHYRYFGFTSLGLSGLCYLILPSITRAHIGRSNDQVEALLVNHKNKLRQKIKDYLENDWTDS
jgi:hypothetical protein